MLRSYQLVAVEQPTSYTPLTGIVLCKYNRQRIPEIGVLSINHNNAHYDKAIIYSRPNSKNLWDLTRFFFPLIAVWSFTAGLVVVFK